MKTFACYCQKCRSANVPGEELCVNCGTPLMLIVTPPSFRSESANDAGFASQEHLLERISNLELNLMRVTNRLGQTLDLMVKQVRTAERQQLLVETLVDALSEAGVLENGKVGEIWRDKQIARREQIDARARRTNTLGQILEASNGTKIDLFTNLVTEGFNIIERGDEKQGVRTLERAAALEAANFPLLFFIGEHYFRLDKRTLARDYLSRAFAAAPSDARTRLLLGVILADEGELTEARQILETAADAGGFAENFALGMIYAAETNFAAALNAFKRALAALPCGETHYLVGSACAELGRMKTALRHFEKAVEQNPNFADAWFMLGAIQMRLGNEPAAKDALNQAIAARDASAQSQAVLRNPKRHAEFADRTLLFARLPQTKKNLISGSSPRLVKLLREEIGRR